jgi:4-amino-4-deoxy-L-arabinose transferase-like glycosyltransferase
MSLTLAIPESRVASIARISLFSGMSAISPAALVIAVIIIGTVARVALAGSTGLGIDESYTVANARNAAWSYVDYPPLHVWLVGAWAWLWHSENPLVVRLPFIAIFASSTWLMFRLTSLLFGTRAGVWAAVAFNLAPVFTAPDAIWVLPDGPLALLMLAATYVVARILFSETPSSERGWLIAGLLAGLALLTKYHGAFVLAGVFAFLLGYQPARRHLANPWPWLGAGLALLVFLPVIVWNAHHDWVGLFFQSKRISKSTGLDPLRIFASIGEQAAYLSPWLFVPLAWVWVRALRRGPAEEKPWFLALLASGPIVFFTAANLFSRGLPHWPMPGWLLVFPLLGAELTRLEVFRPRLVRIGTVSSAAILALVLLVFSTDANNGWLTRWIPIRWASADPTLDLLSWKELETNLIQRQLMQGDIAAVAGTRWFESGKLNYALGKDVPVLCLCADPQQFRYLHDASKYAGRNILIVEPQREYARHGALFAKLFDRVQMLAPVMLHRAGVDALELAVIRGIGFHPPAD